MMIILPVQHGAFRPTRALYLFFRRVLLGCVRSSDPFVIIGMSFEWCELRGLLFPDVNIRLLSPQTPSDREAADKNNTNRAAPAGLSGELRDGIGCCMKFRSGDL